MEIANETKAKIFAHYWGKTFKNGMLCSSALSFQDLQDISNGTIKAILILKPLSEITNEDANNIAEISGFNYLIDLEQFELAGALNCGLKEMSFAYQYLQSKGYDLPNYLLGGKTLKEAGLAIYENEI